MIFVASCYLWEAIPRERKAQALKTTNPILHRLPAQSIDMHDLVMHPWLGIMDTSNSLRLRRTDPTAQAMLVGLITPRNDDPSIPPQRVSAPHMFQNGKSNLLGTRHRTFYHTIDVRSVVYYFPTYALRASFLCSAATQHQSREVKWLISSP